MPSSSEPMSTERGRKSWRRAKASSRWTKVAARLAACRLASIILSELSLGLSRRRSRSRLPMIGVSRLLKSWATPPVSWPSVSSFCASCSLASACSCSRVRCSTRASSVSLAVRSRSSLSCRAWSLALASYWRRRARSAARARLTKVVGWNGRSRKVTLPSVSSRRPASGLRSSPPPLCVSRTNGRSDHSGCSSIQAATGRRSPRSRASSVTSTKPISSPSSRTRQSRSGQISARIFDSDSMPAAIAASRPTGARINAVSERPPSFIFA